MSCCTASEAVMQVVRPDIEVPLKSKVCKQMGCSGRPGDR